MRTGSSVPATKEVCTSEYISETEHFANQSMCEQLYVCGVATAGVWVGQLISHVEQGTLLLRACRQSD